MSYILDALKKSEKERNLGKVPTVADLGEKPLLRPYSSAGWYKKIALGVLGLLLVIVFAFFYITKDKPEAVSEWVQPVDRQTEPERESQDIKRPKNTLQPELALPPDQDILSLKDATLQFPEKNTMINIEDIETPDQVEQQIVETEEVHDNRRLELHEDELFAEPADLEQEEVSPLSLEAEPEPESILNLRLPELTLDIHVYDASQSERFVYINMQKYREGDVIEEGFFVESIDSKGVILDLDGERFRLPIDQ